MSRYTKHSEVEMDTVSTKLSGAQNAVVSATITISTTILRRMIGYLILLLSMRLGRPLLQVLLCTIYPIAVRRVEVDWKRSSCGSIS
jgi:hypothetical protein